MFGIMCFVGVFFRVVLVCWLFCVVCVGVC